MSPSTPQQSISQAWELEAFSPESMGQPPESTSPIRHVARQDVNGAPAQRFQFTDADLHRYFKGRDPYPTTTKQADAAPAAGTQDRSGPRDVLTRLRHCPELAIEIGKHLSPRDIVALYSASCAFHDAVDQFMKGTVSAWIAHMAPEAGRVFDARFYKRHLVADPAGRSWSYQYDTTAAPADNEQGDEAAPAHGSAASHTIDAATAAEVRAIPGLVYLQLVVGRDRYCRDIRALLARNGHRTPASMHGTLLKLWLCLDIPTGAHRAALLRNRDVWADADLYNAQLLFVKLGMHFNDPVYGPNTYELLHLVLGQQRGGLHPLWQLLARWRFTRLADVLALKVRYDFPVAASPADTRVRGVPGHWSAEYFGTAIHGVPYEEIGRGHLERSDPRGLPRHLPRPDELVPVEAVARGLELDRHLVAMMMWGYVDWASGENLVPEEEELRVVCEETAAALERSDTTHHWRPRHARKKRFDALPPAEQRRILDEDEDERLRAMAWCGEIDDYSSAPSDDDEGGSAGCSIEDEMTRGYLVPPRDDEVVVPGVGDADGWVDFVNDVLAGGGLAPEINGEEALRAQAWQSYQDVEMDADWDWGLWLQQQQGQQEQQEQQHGEDGEDGEAAEETEDMDLDSEAETLVSDETELDEL
ncbi:hypothetical protein ISF_00963 [Cordyceps fumosorosea ARSEF 2679]|uniref:Histidine kinase group protein n=1 Tax=Cordyceps fumosorosea (strain ARSEF 2679) TaxID=1081104 RepID=A0A162JUQ0_CORFA|nr:hypothetical protein ISF_00963 [Cordyceps fumosorosea ARSEF 2679]OAA74062.1 hypothetical protein ISF_00963 [Cordyceps fumosorosea ARSEF 2679]